MKVGIVFNSASFIHGAGILSYRFLRYLTVDDIWNLIFKITQSRTEFKIDETFHIKICAVEIPRGLGRNKKSTLNRKNMRSIIQISGDDNFCFPKALLVAKTRIEHRKDVTNKEIYKKYTSIKKY